MSRPARLARLLGVDLPIVQGPFGGGLSTARLVAAVSNAGALGSYGAHLLKAEEIGAVASEIRTLTSRPFALNLWVPSAEGEPGLDAAVHAEQVVRLSLFYAELGVEPPGFQQPALPDFDGQLAAVIEARPAALSFVFGVLSPEQLEACRRVGIVTIGAATTPEEAEAIEAAGADAVVASGCEAGGHRPSFLRPAEDSLIGTMALVPRIADRISIPVIAAGGIADARGVAAALALGADGVQVGSAFLACEESGAAPAHRERLGEGDARTRLSRAFTGRLARFMSNRILDACDGMMPGPLPYPLQGHFLGPIKQAAAQRADPEFMALYAGQGAPLARWRGAAELVRALAASLGATSGAADKP